MPMSAPPPPPPAPVLAPAPPALVAAAAAAASSDAARRQLQERFEYEQHLRAQAQMRARLMTPASAPPSEMSSAAPAGAPAIPQMIHASFAHPAASYSPAAAMAKPDWPSFTISQSNPRFAFVHLRCDSFLPLRDWLPFIAWDGAWIESWPMQTTFRVPAPLLDVAVKALLARGFHAKQSRLAARM